MWSGEQRLQIAKHAVAVSLGPAYAEIAQHEPVHAVTHKLSCAM